MKRTIGIGCGLVLGSVFAASLALVSGCASARVSNEASFKITAPDGTVTERFAKNNIFAMGDKAVEQNLKGSLADATEADLSAGIAESVQKSESGAIAEGLFATLDKGLDTFGKYLESRVPLPASASDSAPPVMATQAALTAYSEDSAPNVQAAGYTGIPGAGGVGVYGRTTCTRCQTYKAAHPDVDMIDLNTPGYRTTMWDALAKRGYSGGSVGLPVVVTETGFVTSAK